MRQRSQDKTDWAPVAALLGESDQSVYEVTGGDPALLPVQPTTIVARGVSAYYTARKEDPPVNRREFIGAGAALAASAKCSWALPLPQWSVTELAELKTNIFSLEPVFLV